MNTIASPADLSEKEITAAQRRAAPAVELPPAIQTENISDFSTAKLNFALNNGLGITANGRLWASWIAGEDGPGAFTVAAYSDDGGDTWSDVEFVINGHAQDATDRTNIIGTFWLDPDGHFHIFTDQSVGHFDGRAGFWEATCDNPDAAVTKWSQFRRLGHGHLLNKPIVLANGLWAMTGYLNKLKWGTPAEKAAFASLDAERGATCYISADHGKTWEKRGTAIFPGDDWQESQLIQLKDGTLRVFARVREEGVGKLMAADSADEGCTWSAPFTLESMDNPATRFQIMRLKSGRLLFVKNGAPDAGGKDDQERDQLTAYLSEDDGATWLGGLELFHSHASYPDVCQGPDGMIYVTHDHDRGGAAEIWFHRFSEEDILAGKIVSPKGRLAILVSKAMMNNEPIVPYLFSSDSVERACSDLRHIRETVGLRRFFLCGPSFNRVMYAPFPADLYAKMGAEMAEVKRRLADTDIELGWWCAPSIRYVADFASIEDAWGNKSADNKKCPLDPTFQADWAAKIKSVAEVFHPFMINIEDDYTLAWGRGLKNGACFCKRHLESFAKHYGKPLTGPEINEAFVNRTPENLPIRRAFAETIRDSLCELAAKVRAAVDEVDPSIRICLCEPGGCVDKDGNALEAILRAFAGPHTRPAVRPAGSIYGAQTTPADIPSAIGHTMFTLERLPKDVDTFYESDPYPHNRFYTSAAQMQSLMAGATFMGSRNFLFYCLQYLDDPLEDPGYANAYNAMKPHLDAVRAFITSRDSHLEGARAVHLADDLALTRTAEGGHGCQAQELSFMLSKFGIPYTTRRDAKGPAILIGGIAETMPDDEILRLLSGGVFLDAPAADMLQKRGFGKYLGADIEIAEGRLPVIGERILPAAGLTRKGRNVNAFYILCAGTEGTVSTFATLKPHEGTEVWSEFTGLGEKLVTPSITLAKNSLGGRVAILATSVIGNRSSGLYNLRKQELIRNLFDRLTPGAIPVTALDAPGIWNLAQVSHDGREMLVMVNNLSGDVRDNVALRFSEEWSNAKISRLGEDGKPIPLGLTSARWTVPFSLGQMIPEYLLVDFQ